MLAVSRKYGQKIILREGLLGDREITICLLKRYASGAVIGLDLPDDIVVVRENARTNKKESPHDKH